MLKALLIFSVLVGPISATGQKLWHKHKTMPVPPVCYASDKIEKVFIPPPFEVTDKLKSAATKSDFVVNYSLFPQQAKDAFEYAVSIMEQLIESPVPIYIDANWRRQSQNVLGSCAPSDFEKNFEGAPRWNVYYPIALVEKITGSELTGPERADLTATFNQEISWYFGTDGNTPVSMYDFVSVVLHEICHGLGFTGFFYVSGQSGGYSMWEVGDKTSFDLLVERFNGDNLVDSTIYDNPSEPLRNALVSNLLYANSPVVLNEFTNTRPRLYAPLEWDDGSSVYHLNDQNYPAGNANALMTHAVGRGEAIHDPGPYTMGILADLGWKHLHFGFTPVKDIEVVQTVQFETSINSDFPVDTQSVVLVLSTDTFKTHQDTIPLELNDSGFYAAEWTPESGTGLYQYYIRAVDDKSRIFYSPSGAPVRFHELNVGPDMIPPEIEHQPLSYYLAAGNDLEIEVVVDDNVGVESVYVEYSVNGEPRERFRLTPGPDNRFSSVFPLNEDMLNDGDVVEYRIIATDSSGANNTASSPEIGNFSFVVEKIFEPVSEYFTDFANSASDFVLFDFDISIEPGFEDEALHSPHPYPSPGVDNEEFNFETILKYPVVLSENAIMSFDEIVLVEPGEKNTEYGDSEFWDYVIVEGSKDRGETWLPVADGYDSRKNAAWENAYNDSITGNNSSSPGTSELFVTKTIDLLANGNFSPGDTVLFRFRLFSDPYAYGWGWAIDNLQIQFPVSASKPVLSPGNLLVYPNPFTDLIQVDIQANSEVEELQIELYNAVGQMIRSARFSNVSGRISSSIEMENRAKGLYLLVVRENGKKVFTKKLIRN